VSGGTVFTAAVAAVVSVTSIGIYDRLVLQRPRPMAIADVARVYSDGQAEFQRKVSEAADDAARDKAVTEAKEFGKKLEKALAVLTQDCGCLVLSRSAVLDKTPEMVDLTAQLKVMVARDE
jgi:hypothetical protein